VVERKDNTREDPVIQPVFAPSTTSAASSTITRTPPPPVNRTITVGNRKIPAAILRGSSLSRSPSHSSFVSLDSEGEGGGGRETPSTFNFVTPLPSRSSTPIAGAQVPPSIPSPRRKTSNKLSRESSTIIKTVEPRTTSSRPTASRQGNTDPADDSDGAEDEYKRVNHPPTISSKLDYMPPRSHSSDTSEVKEQMKKLDSWLDSLLMRRSYTNGLFSSSSHGHRGLESDVDSPRKRRRRSDNMNESFNSMFLQSLLDHSPTHETIQEKIIAILSSYVRTIL
jgi:hypothetical protein